MIASSDTSDYASVGGTRLEFPVGISQVFFELPLVDDYVIEEDEEIKLHLSDPSIGYIAGIETVDVTIIDDDGKM